MTKEEVIEKIDSLLAQWNKIWELVKDKECLGERVPKGFSDLRTRTLTYLESFLPYAKRHTKTMEELTNESVGCHIRILENLKKDINDGYMKVGDCTEFCANFQPKC